MEGVNVCDVVNAKCKLTLKFLPEVNIGSRFSLTTPRDSKDHQRREHLYPDLSCL